MSKYKFISSLRSRLPADNFIGLPVLIGHDPSNQVLGIVQTARLEKETGRIVFEGLLDCTNSPKDAATMREAFERQETARLTHPEWSSDPNKGDVTLTPIYE